jgi:endonuclease/exonuclease/phosphatase family metal-dependent hydrolase
MKTQFVFIALAAAMAGMTGRAGDLAATGTTKAAPLKAATPGGELRLIQYNIRSFEGYATKWDRCNEVVKRGQLMERCALELNLYDPDVISLEEVPSEAAAAALAKRLGMHYAHFKGGWRGEGWPEGISGAVLSKYPIVEAKIHPSLNWTERPEDLFTRFWGRVVLDTPAGPLVVHAMHGYHKDSAIRLRELAEVLPVIAGDVQAGKSVILMGDMNHEPDSPEYRQIAAAGLADAFAGVTGVDLRTCPSTVRTERIDYIWSAGPISKRLKSARVLFEGAFRTNPDDPDSYALSDHVPVLAVFRRR